MSRKELFEKVAMEQIIGVVRENSVAAAESVAEAYRAKWDSNPRGDVDHAGGVRAHRAIRAERSRRMDVVIAAGTVRSANDAAQARRAGAQIIVSPHTDVSVIEYANEHDLLCVAGAGTATEIIRAWEAGCDIVKVFPALYLGGPDYIRTLRGPIRDVPMLAGGPVPLDTIESYLDAGCIAVNLGASLAVPDLVNTEQWEEIGRRALLATSIIQSRNVAITADSYVH